MVMSPMLRWRLANMLLLNVNQYSLTYGLSFNKYGDNNVAYVIRLRMFSEVFNRLKYPWRDCQIEIGLEVTSIQ